MKRLVIIGAGGHGKVVADAAELMGLWGEIVFVDKLYPELAHCGAWSVVADGLNSALLDDAELMIAIGDNHVRDRVFCSAIALGACMATVIHPSAVVSAYASLGKGSFLAANVVINAGTEIAENCIINTAATVDHDCSIGRAVHISPGAHIAGEVSIGNFSWIGTGVATKQVLSIGRNVIVGVGAAVVNDLADDAVYVGVPAKPLEK